MQARLFRNILDQYLPCQGWCLGYAKLVSYNYWPVCRVQQALPPQFGEYLHNDEAGDNSMDYWMLEALALHPAGNIQDS